MRQVLLPAVLLVLLVSCKKTKDPDPIPNNKALKWAKTLGGSEYDMANSVIQLQAGDYVMAGTTRSTDGDITGNRVGYDAWLAKTDVNGNKTWSMTFGESNDDYANGVASTPDGGFLIAGYTFVNYQNYAWIIKTDANGNQQWQKSLNQSTDSKATYILPNGDGSYIIVGYITTNAAQDGWVTKVDATGNIAWSKTYGGSGEDQFTSAIKTNDGYILTGYSKSSDGSMARNRGNFDGWIMKIDQSGNKVWTTNFGGSSEDYLKSIASAGDGGFIVAGYTKSTDGDIPLNRGGYDEWLIKIDASGSKQWIKTFGGLNEEYITNIVSTGDGSFLTVGYTNSTTWDVLRVNNDFGGWMIKIDGNGNKTASSTYGTDRFDDFTNSLIPTQDGGYLMGGYSYANGKGYDGWLVKIDKL
jgi:hypothetical protein